LPPERERIMSWRENWPSWQPPHDADDPDRDGGMSQLGGERQRAMGYAWRLVAAQQEQAVGGRLRQAY